MWGKVLKVTGLVALGVLDVVLSSDDSADQHQLDMLNDGMGNINADGESMTRQEAEDKQALGELYDTYY
ncbi:hypothetical protein [Alkalimonas amylolytica]|uniref:Uncharacterized protein n=1 Tax=Alkalimonas amylolytica TaxID=152573 RepID=A0A1H3XTF6_ALKAM|nr:hypothetical protein [Alkalimonas amylolytica]SEA01808.1 hypothetical protein SAMN04488051_101354 [Alkalimonas amylolytica]